MKRFIAILLAAVCTACLLVTAACGKGGAKYDPENFLTAAEAKAQYNNEYRIVKDQVEIQIFVPRGTMNPAYSTMKMFKKLSEITNLKFDFIEAETSSYTNLRTTAWMDGELPDFFLFGNTVSEQVMYSEEGELIAFNDNSLVVEGVEVGNLIDNYMPTYKALLDKNFNIDTDLNAKQIATMLDGKMYSTVSAKDVPRDMTYKMWINEKWIENINTMPALNAKLKAQFGVDKIPTADEIKTIDDFLLVLRAFKKLDANANGNADDEIPATALAMQYLRNFLLRETESIGPRAALVGIEAIEPGDVIQLSFQGIEYQHTALVVAVLPPVSPESILVAAHSIDVDYRPLSTYDYQQIRYLHILGSTIP